MPNPCSSYATCAITVSKIASHINVIVTEAENEKVATKILLLLHIFSCVMELHLICSKVLIDQINVFELPIKASFLLDMFECIFKPLFYCCIPKIGGTN